MLSTYATSDRLLRVIIAVGIVILLYPNIKTEAMTKDQVTTGMEEAAIFANARLAEHNKTDGIEYVRGPFRLDDYDCNCEPLSHDGILVKWEYKKQDDFAGWPSHFDIAVRFYDALTLPRPSAPPPARERFAVIGELSDKDLQAITETFRAFCNYKEEGCKCCEVQYYATDMVTVSDEGQIERSHNAVYGCHSICRLDDNRVLVMYNVENGWEFKRIDFFGILQERDWYDKYHEPSISGDEPGQHLLFERKGTAWQARFLSDHDHRIARSPVRWKKQRPKLKPQLIELKGRLTDEELLALLNDAIRVRGMSEAIKAIKVEGDYALVSAGKYLEKLPDNAVTVERSGEKWKIVRHYDLMNFHTLAGHGDMSAIFPLLPKPKSKQLASAVKRCKAPKSLTEQDVEQICELVLRIPGLEGGIGRIKFIGKDKNKVEVMMGSLGLHFVRLRRVGGQWTLIAKGARYI